MAMLRLFTSAPWKYMRRSWDPDHSEVATSSENYAFVEVRNLFNQADDEDNATNSGGGDYMRMGLTDPRPNDKNLLKYGDLTEASKVYEPRQANFGIRVVF